MVSFEESIQVDLNDTYKRIAYIFSPEIFGLKIILKFCLSWARKSTARSFLNF